MTFDPSFPMAILESLVREGRTDGAEGGDVLGRALVGPGPEGDGYHDEIVAGDSVGEEIGRDGIAVLYEMCIRDSCYDLPSERRSLASESVMPRCMRPACLS